MGLKDEWWHGALAPIMVAERMLGWEWSNSKAHIFHEVVFLEQIKKERIDTYVVATCINYSLSKKKKKMQQLFWNNTKRLGIKLTRLLRIKFSKDLLNQLTHLAWADPLEF